MSQIIPFFKIMNSMSKSNLKSDEAIKKALVKAAVIMSKLSVQLYWDKRTAQFSRWYFDNQDDEQQFAHYSKTNY